MFWFFISLSYLCNCPCPVSFGMWPTHSWIVEAPLFSFHSPFSPRQFYLPCSFKRCHLSPLKSIFLNEAFVQLPNMLYHWVVPLAPQVQHALNWTYFLHSPAQFLMLDLHAIFYCFSFINPQTVNGWFLLSLLIVTSLVQDHTSITCISLLMGLSPAILTCSNDFYKTTKISLWKMQTGIFLKNFKWLLWSTGWAS